MKDDYQEVDVEEVNEEVQTKPAKAVAKKKKFDVTELSKNTKRTDR
jgi:hypothetical protein